MGSVALSSWVFSANAVDTFSSPRRTQSRTFPSKPFKIRASLNDSIDEYSQPSSSNSLERVSEKEPHSTDPVKLAFARAKEYRKSMQSDPPPKKDEKSVSNSVETDNGSDGSVSDDIGGKTKEVPVSVKLAMEKAREYKKSEGARGILDSNSNVGKRERDSGPEGTKRGNIADGFSEERVSKKEALTISSLDFVGLDFSDKKQSRGLPAGLVPVADPFPEGDLPEVEFIAGDASMFDIAAPLKDEQNENDDSNLYKPKVSTWGVFPRPSNISKTFGGGRTIRPGEVLETAEDKAAKQARSRQLLAAYKNKMGIIIDAKLKSECEKALKDGDYLMDLGKLKEALPYYEKVMEDLSFQSELHGLAALQWSICQDSRSRPNEARVMYEKLRSHPNVQVSKKAKQFMFGFQAMEIMKVTNSSLSAKTTGYQDYFEAFIKDKANYPPREAGDEEGFLSQALPYVLFLVSPILIVLFIAARKVI